MKKLLVIKLNINIHGNNIWIYSKLLKLINNKKIIVIDNSNLAYSGKDINGKFLRGTETSLILLSEFLVKKNISVDYCNCIENKEK